MALAVRCSVWALAGVALVVLGFFALGWKLCDDLSFGFFYAAIGPAIVWPWVLVAAAIGALVRAAPTTRKLFERPKVEVLTFLSLCAAVMVAAYAFTEPHAATCHFGF